MGPKSPVISKVISAPLMGVTTPGNPFIFGHLYGVILGTSIYNDRRVPDCTPQPGLFVVHPENQCGDERR